MIIVDTSALIDSLVGERRSASRMRGFIEAAERLALPTIVLYEWRRGPRQNQELAAQEALFPSEMSLPFGIEQAQVAASLYRSVARPRGRELDLAIAAHALSQDAELWSLNTEVFEDIPGLKTIPPGEA